jgi:O-antigen/teichoic acid export membrane protein
MTSVTELPAAAPSGRLPRRYRRNLVSEYARTGAAAVIALLVTPILVHHLGVERYGIWALVGSIALYLELLEFGFGTATVKYVAEFAGAGNLNGVRGTIATSFWVLAVPGFVALLLGGALAAVFPAIFNLSPSLVDAARILLLLVITDLALSIPSDTFGGTLIGLQRYDLLNASIVGTSVAQAIAWTIILASGGGLVALGVATLALGLAGQASRYLIARRHVPRLSIAPRLIDRTIVRSLASLSGWYAMIDLAVIVVQRIDVIIVGLVVNVPAAGVYAVGQKLAFAVEQVIAPVTKGFLPHASELASRDDESQLRNAIVTGTRISFAVAAPLCLALGFLAGPLVHAWVGAGFDDARLVVVYLVVAAGVGALTRPGFLMLQGVGTARPTAFIRGGEAILNLGLSIELGRRWGLTGVAFATMVAGALTNLGLLLPLICRRFGLRFASLLGPVARAHVPAMTVGLLVAWLVVWQHPTGVWALGGMLAIIAAYTCTFAATGLDREERRHLRAFVGKRNR